VLFVWVDGTGVGIYEDSDEESGTDSEADGAKQTNGLDSDEDLRVM